MNGLIIPVSVAVKRLRGNIHFLQPLFEAISNSLEAHASVISIKASVDSYKDLLGNDINKISGYTIEDNGDGFNDNNLKSFLTYLSVHKIDLGCKGIGRITWLKVFSSVGIESISDNKVVSFVFDDKFDESKVTVNNLDNHSNNKTKVIFDHVNSKYYQFGSHDDRFDADLPALSQAIEEHLIIKLALLKINNIKFEIIISTDGNNSQEPISNKTIQTLTQKKFSITDRDNIKHDFILYYRIYADKSKQRKTSYICAHGRTVKHIPEKVLSYTILPDNQSSLFILTSQYFDDHVNNERTDFDIPHHGSTLIAPISWDDINLPLQLKVDEILLEHFPDLENNNKSIVDDLINEYPYLAKYIKKDQSRIKDKEKILKAAKELYEKDKDSATKKFNMLLLENKIDSELFYKTVDRINDISARELAEYIVYRKQIITALSKMNNNNEKRERLLHNLFMKMRTDSHKDSHAVYDNNLWLLDDKYMTYVYAASDKTIKQIVDSIEAETSKRFKAKIRPDIAIFYSNNDTALKKDAVIIEFKGLGANLDEKSKSFWEINRNAKVVRSNLNDINRIWAYAITNFDEDFVDNILSQDYRPLFSNDAKNGIYYKYFEHIDAHCYYISIDAILADADARNNIFLDIIKTID